MYITDIMATRKSLEEFEKKRSGFHTATRVIVKQAGESNWYWKWLWSNAHVFGAPEQYRVRANREREHQDLKNETKVPLILSDSAEFQL